MTQYRIELVPVGDRIIFIPNEPERDLGITNFEGKELEKAQKTVDREVYEQSEMIVFRYGKGTPTWLRKQVPEGSVVIVARHICTEHKIPIGREIVPFVLGPSHALLMVKKMMPVIVEEEAEAVVEEATQ